MTLRRALLLSTAAAAGAVLSGCSGDDTVPTASTPVSITGPAARDAATTAPPGSSASSPAGTPQLLPPVDVPSADLDADDQRGDGTQAVIEEVELSAPGHVAVYDPAWLLLGSTPVPAGESDRTVVGLDPSLAQGEHQLRVVVHVDDGDNVFDPARDAPAREIDDDDGDDDIVDDRFAYSVN